MEDVRGFPPLFLEDPPKFSNHICRNGDEQPLSQIHTEAATKLNYVTFERSPADQPALGADGGGGLLSTSYRTEPDELLAKFKKDLFTVSS